jgi:hypothetical protein
MVMDYRSQVEVQMFLVKTSHLFKGLHVVQTMIFILLSIAFFMIREPPFKQVLTQNFLNNKIISLTL